MKLERRTFVQAAAFALLSVSAFASSAQSSYPDRSVRIVVPFPPGGSADSITRLLAEGLSERLGQPFVIENKPGAGGNIAGDVVAKSKADGYSLFMGTAGAMAVNPSLYPSMPYDPVQDFVPVSLVGYTPVLIVANPDAPASNIKELISQAKAENGQLTFASNGNGTAHHLGAEMFMQEADVKMTHISYKGTAPALQDVIGGRVSYGFLDLTSSLPLLQSGRLKPIATTGLNRSPALPDTPTVAESGLPGFEAVGWFGLFAPKGTPAAVVEILNTHVKEVLTRDDVQKQVAALAVETKTGTPEELRSYQVAEVEKWRDVIRKAGVTLE